MTSMPSENLAPCINCGHMVSKGAIWCPRCDEEPFKGVRFWPIAAVRERFAGVCLRHLNGINH